MCFSFDLLNIILEIPTVTVQVTSCGLQFDVSVFIFRFLTKCNIYAIMVFLQSPPYMTGACRNKVTYLSLNLAEAAFKVLQCWCRSKLGQMFCFNSLWRSLASWLAEATCCWTCSGLLRRKRYEKDTNVMTSFSALLLTSIELAFSLVWHLSCCADLCLFIGEMNRTFSHSHHSSCFV